MMPLFIYPPSNRSAIAVHFHRQFLDQQIAAITSFHGKYKLAHSQVDPSFILYIIIPDQACLFVAIIDSETSFDGLKKSFPYFGQFGLNHLLLDLSGKLRPDQVGSAILLSSSLTTSNFRQISLK